MVATGATHSYFGHPEWERYAPGLKTLEDALEIRRRVLLAFERAEREADPARREALLTFVIVGGGPDRRGARRGASPEISRRALTRRLPPHRPAPGADRPRGGGCRGCCPPFPEPSRRRRRRRCERLGVEVRTGEQVTAIDEERVSLGDERIDATTVLWAAGVQASPLAASLGAPLDRAGRVMVTPRLTIPGHDEVFVIGDLAHLEQDGQPVPGIAPAAMQEGRYVAKAIERMRLGEEVDPFRYFNWGTFAVIGRGAAVGLLLGRYRFSGFFAWLLWLFIHILYLVGFRNRIVVMVEWAYSFLTLGRSSRLITYDLPAAPHRLPAPDPHRGPPGGAATRPS